MAMAYVVLFGHLCSDPIWWEYIASLLPPVEKIEAA